MEKDLNEKGFTFSIHAAQVGSDMPSTSSRSARLISIHAAQVGSDLKSIKVRFGNIISIHAAQVGSDKSLNFRRVRKKLFQSTLPKWAATGLQVQVRRRPSGISIHAAQVGSDRVTSTEFNTNV